MSVVVSMQLIIGLGNPGQSYEQTRHNIGYMVLDKLAKELSDHALVWDEDVKHDARVAKAGGVLLVKPITFMNNSGEAVGKLVSFYKLQASDVIVVHDDIDLPLGNIRIREKGASGGHKGVESILRVLGTDAFTRVRLGIGRGGNVDGDTPKHIRQHAVVDFVLHAFGQHEQGEVRKLIDHGVNAIRTILYEGVDVAMHKFH